SSGLFIFFAERCTADYARVTQGKVSETDTTRCLDVPDFKKLKRVVMSFRFGLNVQNRYLWRENKREFFSQGHRFFVTRRKANLDLGIAQGKTKRDIQLGQKTLD
ncbi:MAG: hypothetical protein M3O33_17085, partial [Cyanobacteriota bacterium]|nr:hypothetical protein [Cyanobacteriota bacterium]